MTLKEKVKFILERHEEARNSDITLTILLWKEFYPQRIFQGRQGDSIHLSDLYELDRMDDIKRIRADFNSKMMLLPTKLEVIKARGIKEAEKFR